MYTIAIYACSIYTRGDIQSQINHVEWEEGGKFPFPIMLIVSQYTPSCSYITRPNFAPHPSESSFPIYSTACQLTH